MAARGNHDTQPTTTCLLQAAPKMMSRRLVLQLLSGAAAAAAMPVYAELSASGLSAADEAFLDDLQRRASMFFWEQADPASGQVLDRAYAYNTDGKLHSVRPLSSIAATGFGLTALCIADKRGYLPHDEILTRVRNTLNFHLNKLAHDHGFFSHFNNVYSGAPASGSEISSIDTSILLCGVLTARAYFHDPQITDMATKIYERVDWPWMLNGGNTFSMGVRNGRFIETRWDHYCELMMIYLLAIGSPTHPVPPALWDNFTRPKISYDGFEFIAQPGDSLFVHQYSHAWFDFRYKRDKYADYFANSILATRAHKAFLVALKMGYTDDYWGLTASDMPSGYGSWGGPPGFGPIDGTVVPCATAGSLPFLPVDCLRVQKSLKQTWGEKVYLRYGFRDAVHPAANWYDTDVLGIDLGISALMAENLRSGFVWDTFMQNPEPGRAMLLCGFKPT
jgi:hypothetical protein